MAESLTYKDEEINCAPYDKANREDETDERPTNETPTRINEHTPLIMSASSTPEAAHILEDVSDRIKIDTTWRHILIGPVVWLHFFSMISGFFVLMIYTKQYWNDIEYKAANLSVSTTVSPCDDNVSSLVSDTDTKATSKSSEWIMYYSLAAGVPAVISNLIVGAYMDYFGRKMILTVSILGNGLRLLVQGIVIFFKADIGYFLIACVVEGFTGQHATCFAGALAFMADITRPGKSRALGLAVIEACVQTAIAFASFSTGYLIEGFGFMTTMYIDAGLLTIALLTTTCILPETCKKDANRAEKSLVKNLKVVCQFFTRNDEKNSRWKYQVTIIALALTNMSILSRFPIETLYQLTHPFCWTPAKSGVYFSVRNVCKAVIGFGSLKLWQKFFDEVSLAMLGSLSFAASLYWTAFLEDDISYYLVIAVGVFGPIATVMQRTILSHLTPPNKQGSIFTSVGVLEIVASLIGNVTTSAIYAETVTVMHGLVFLVLGTYNALAFLLASVLKIGWRRERRWT